MADRTRITPQKLDNPSGETVTFVAVDDTNGMKYVNSGREIVLVKSAAASGYDITIKSRADAFGRTGDVSVTGVGASLEKAYGPYTPAENWGDGVDGLLDFANVLGTVTIAVILT